MLVHTSTQQDMAQNYLRNENRDIDVWQTIFPIK